MIIWKACTYKEFLEASESEFKSGRILHLINRQYLGDEKEPMDYFEWAWDDSKLPVLRSTLTVNKELYWRAE